MLLLLFFLTLILGFSVPAIAHNEANGGDALHSSANGCGNEDHNSGCVPDESMHEYCD